MDTKDYYHIMGITPDASEKEIKSVYRKLAMQYHPDRNENDSHKAERLKEINDAYHVLGNKRSKMTYDMMYSRGIKVNPETIFRAYSARNFKASGKSFSGRRGFGRRGCGRKWMWWE